MPPKKKNPPTQSRRKNRNKPAKARRTPVQPPAPILDTVFNRYLRCLATGTAAGTGVPDGNPAPSVVRNIRDTITLTPDQNGRIFVYVVPTLIGTVHLTSGNGPTTWRYLLDSTTASGIKTESASTGGRMVGPTLSVGVPNLSSNMPQVGRARLVNAVHVFRYTGPPLTAGGSVTVDERAITGGIDSTYATTGQPRPCRLMRTADVQALTPKALVGSAKDTFSVLHLPRNTDYVPPEVAISNAGYSAIGVPTSAAGTVGVNYRPLVDRAYVVTYSGLDPSASITVDCRVCVQEEIGASAHHQELLPFAKSSDNASPGVLDAFLSAAGTHRLYEFGADAARTIAFRAATAAGRALGTLATGASSMALKAIRDEL